MWCFISYARGEPYQHLLNQKGGGILLYVRSDNHTKLLTKHNFTNDIEEFLVEINGYFLEHITHPNKMINVILAV